ncbi:hypothetical protein AB0K16_45415 [Nonomuraea jabiensis]|uniref:hypothetical protein n=1 Tax=Nonomuraea jabiensis TaxID=882448 RepID=UPI00342225DF
MAGSSGASPTAGTAAPEMCARLSPICYEYIKFMGRYAFTLADPAAGLRRCRDPSQER